MSSCDIAVEPQITAVTLKVRGMLDESAPTESAPTESVAPPCRQGKRKFTSAMDIAIIDWTPGPPCQPFKTLLKVPHGKHRYAQMAANFSHHEQYPLASNHEACIDPRIQEFKYLTKKSYETKDDFENGMKELKNAIDSVLTSENVEKMLEYLTHQKLNAPTSADELVAALKKAFHDTIDRDCLKDIAPEWARSEDGARKRKTPTSFEPPPQTPQTPRKKARASPHEYIVSSIERIVDGVVHGKWQNGELLAEPLSNLVVDGVVNVHLLDFITKLSQRAADSDTRGELASTRIRARDELAAVRAEKDAELAALRAGNGKDAELAAAHAVLRRIRDLLP